MKKFAKNISVYLILFLVVLMVAMFYKGLDSDQRTVTEVSFSKFAQMVEQEKFEAVQIENTTLTGQINKETYYYAYAPSVLEINWLEETYLFDQMQKGTLKEFSSPKPDTGSFLWNLLPNLLMILSLIHI